MSPLYLQYTRDGRFTAFKSFSYVMSGLPVTAQNAFHARMCILEVRIMLLYIYGSNPPKTEISGAGIGLSSLSDKNQSLVICKLVSQL